MGQVDITPIARKADQRNLDWYIDKAVQVLVFFAGISAIIFIIGIFVFITKEGIGFIAEIALCPQRTCLQSPGKKEDAGRAARCTDGSCREKI